MAHSRSWTSSEARKAELHCQKQAQTCAYQKPQRVEDNMGLSIGSFMGSLVKKKLYPWSPFSSLVGKNKFLEISGRTEGEKPGK